MINRPDEFVRKMNCYGILRRLQIESVSHRYRIALLQRQIRPVLASLQDLNRCHRFIASLMGVKPWHSYGREHVASLLEQLMCLARTLEAILHQSNRSTQLLRSAIALLNPIGTERTTWADTHDMAVTIETSFRGSGHLLTRLEIAVEQIDRSVRLTLELN